MAAAHHRRKCFKCRIPRRPTHSAIPRSACIAASPSPASDGSSPESAADQTDAYPEVQHSLGSKRSRISADSAPERAAKTGTSEPDPERKPRSVPAGLDEIADDRHLAQGATRLEA